MTERKITLNYYNQHNTVAGADGVGAAAGVRQIGPFALRFLVLVLVDRRAKKTIADDCNAYVCL